MNTTIIIISVIVIAILFVFIYIAMRNFNNNSNKETEEVVEEKNENKDVLDIIERHMGEENTEEKVEEETAKIEEVVEAPLEEVEKKVESIEEVMPVDDIEIAVEEAGKEEIEADKQEETVSTPVEVEEVNETPIAEKKESTKVLLVVDDNKINLKVAARMLNEFNYEVDQANGGLECLEIVKNNIDKYDIIFMDIMMPDLDGVETMKKLKEMEGFHTPIIALTADAMEGSREKYLAYGFDEYVSKPIIKQVLQEALGKYVELDDISIISNQEELNNYKHEDNTEAVENTNTEASSEDTEIL